MKKFSRLTLVSAVCFFCGCVAAQGDKADSAGGRIMVMDGSRLQAGFDMGVDSQNRDHGWLARENGYFRMDYPGGQSWGAVFVTIGKPKPKPRPFRDFSLCKVLSVDMKGSQGGEKIAIGIKTNDQPDDGTETKIDVDLTGSWNTYQFPLKSFDGADPAKLYVVPEFVFEGDAQRTVYFRNISCE